MSEFEDWAQELVDLEREMSSREKRIKELRKRLTEFVASNGRVTCTGGYVAFKKGGIRRSFKMELLKVELQDRFDASPGLIKEVLLKSSVETRLEPTVIVKLQPAST